MKKTRTSVFLAAMMIAGIIFHSCQKEETSNPENRDYQVSQKSDLIPPDCSTDCIDENDLLYFELSDSKSIKIGANTKVVSYTAFNTLEDFVVNVSFNIAGPSNAKAKISIDIEGNVMFFEEVAKGSTVSHAIALPEDWEACNEISFTIEQKGLGTPIVFEGIYDLIPACPEGLIDIDGNQYNTIIIETGSLTLEWMAENLKTTKYSDGTSIEYPGSDNEAWSTNTSGAYAWFTNDESRIDTYGALYNWHAVNNENGLCPAGWRVPTDAEWTVLINYAGGATVAGGKLKSTRTDPDSHPRWIQPNTGASDEFGFSALPGGIRSVTGVYLQGNFGRWWSSTELNEGFAWMSGMRHDNTAVQRGTISKQIGYSVRCVRELQ